MGRPAPPVPNKSAPRRQVPAPLSLRSRSAPPPAWSPPCDIYETDCEFVVTAELPGARREEIRVNVEADSLTLRGERKIEEETRRDDYRRAERRLGEFTRSFTIPNAVDPNRIHAEFINGLLTVTLPKREEALPRKIAINIK
jgi:HSP20 family protein